jgi:hypothetical protein
MASIACDRLGQEPRTAMNRIKINEPFIPHRRSMLESPAWRMLPPLARQVVDAIELELMRHAGKDNGQLVVSYADFAKYCTASTHKRLIARAIREAEALGFLIIVRGTAGVGKNRLPNQYRLTYMLGLNGGPPSDEWSEIETIKDAQSRLASVKKPRPQTNWFKAANVVGFPCKT